MFMCNFTARALNVTPSADAKRAFWKFDKVLLRKIFFCVLFAVFSSIPPVRSGRSPLWWLYPAVPSAKSVKKRTFTVSVSLLPGCGSAASCNPWLSLLKFGCGSAAPSLSALRETHSPPPSIKCGGPNFLNFK